jgi:hypothetical protein
MSHQDGGFTPGYRVTVTVNEEGGGGRIHNVRCGKDRLEHGACMASGHRTEGIEGQTNR